MSTASPIAAEPVLNGAVRPVEATGSLPALQTRQAIRNALEELEADPEPNQNVWGMGWDQGYAAALHWVLRDQDWTVAP